MKMEKVAENNLSIVFSATFSIFIFYFITKTSSANGVLTKISFALKFA